MRVRQRRAQGDEIGVGLERTFGDDDDRRPQLGRLGARPRDQRGHARQNLGAPAGADQPARKPLPGVGFAVSQPGQSGRHRREARRFGLDLHRPGEGKGAAGGAAALQCHIAAHRPRQTPRDGQAEAAAAVLARQAGVALHEGFEDVLMQRRVDAGAGVFDAHDGARAAVVADHEFARQHHMPALGELDGVGGQVGHHLAHARRVAEDVRHVAGPVEAHRHRLGRGATPHRRHQRAQDFGQQLRQVERLQRQLDAAGVQARQVENLIDQLQQRAARSQRDVEITPLRRLLGGLEGELGQAEQAVERRAQFVAHVGQELALGVAGPLGLFALALRLGQGDVELLGALGHHRAQAMAVFVELLPVELLLMHVADHAAHAQATLRVVLGAAAAAEPAPAAVGQAQPIAGCPGAGSHPGARDLGFELRPVFGVHAGHEVAPARRRHATRVAEQLPEVVADEEVFLRRRALEVRFAGRIEGAVVAPGMGVGVEARLALGVHVDHRADQAQRALVALVDPDAAEGASPAVVVVDVAVAHVVAEGAAGLQSRAVGGFELRAVLGVDARVDAVAVLRRRQTEDVEERRRVPHLPAAHVALPVRLLGAEHDAQGTTQVFGRRGSDERFQQLVVQRRGRGQKDWHLKRATALLRIYLRSRRLESSARLYLELV